MGGGHLPRTFLRVVGSFGNVEEHRFLGARLATQISAVAHQAATGMLLGLEHGEREVSAATSFCHV